MIDDLDQFSRNNKKYSKKKILKIGLKKIATALLYTALGVMVIPEITNAVKINFQNNKSDTQIFEDSQYFNADMRVAQYLASSNFLTKSNFRRLPHNNDKPIYVAVSDSFDQEEKQMIYSVLSDYENLFSNINQHYKFEIVNEFQAYFQSLIGNNVIYYNEKDIEPSGLNQLKPNLFNFNYTKDSIITIDRDLVDKNEKYYAIMHETAHSFGLGDIYDSAVRHFDTFMLGSRFSQKIQMLYPNDVAMFYAMYCEDIRSGQNINNENLLKAKNSFENYKNLFYEKAINLLKKEYSFTETKAISEDILNNKIFSFEMFNYNEKTNQIDEFVYKIQTINENDAKFSITNEQNQLLWESTIKYDYHNGSLFLPSVYFSKGQYPSIDTNDEVLKSAEFFVIAKINETYQFFAPDSNYKTRLTLNDKSLEMAKQNNIVFIPTQEQKLENNIEF